MTAQRASTWPDGTLRLDPEGPYTLPLDSVLLHRFKLDKGEVVDLYDGISDDEVRDRDRTHPRAMPEPTPPPVRPNEPISLEEKVTQLQELVDTLLIDVLAAAEAKEDN